MKIEKDYTIKKRRLLSKIPCDENLRCFFRLLSERDCLMARTIYLTSMSINDVFDLWLADLPDVEIPFHLKKDLMEFCGNRNLESYVFVNHKGLKVSRTVLNISFAKASRAMKCAYKMTPGMLAKWIETDEKMP